LAAAVHPPKLHAHTLARKLRCVYPRGRVRARFVDDARTVAPVDDEQPPRVYDPRYRLGLLHDALTRRGMPTDATTPVSGEVLRVSAEVSRFANRVIARVARSQPYPLRYLAALLETWARICDELAVAAEDLITGHLTGDLDDGLGRLFADGADGADGRGSGEPDATPPTGS
jgi:hypothetical protein